MRMAAEQGSGLEAPSLTALLGCRGDLFAIAALTWQDEAAPAGHLEADAVYMVAEWALMQVADGDDGATLARLCEFYGQRPSSYLGLTDSVLAYTFDMACLAATARDSEPATDDGHIRFTVPDAGGAA